MSRAAAQSLICNRFGVRLPYLSMGKVDTLNLFDPNELVIFAIYEARKGVYKRALDIGANMGLHAMLMLNHGWEVRSFEPDPKTYAQMAANVISGMSEDHLGRWESYQAAVSDRDGTAPFIRVLNNLTGSHLEGFKDSYGPLESLNVNVLDAAPQFDWASAGGRGLAKVDAEGHEAVILSQATPEHMQALDIITEVRGDKEGASLLRHFGKMGIPIYSQKIGWKEVRCMAQMPKHHSEGSLFISAHGAPFE